MIFLFLVPLFGIEVKGSKRWIDFYFLPRFQPIELVKPFLIISISLILSNEKYNNIYLKYSFSFFLTGIVALLLILQPDIGQTLIVFFIWSTLIFTSGINVIFLIIFFLFIVLTISCLIFFVSKFEYIKDRILSFLIQKQEHNAQSEKAIESKVWWIFGHSEGTLKNRVQKLIQITSYLYPEEFGIIILY